MLALLLGDRVGGTASAAAVEECQTEIAALPKLTDYRTRAESRVAAGKVTSAVDLVAGANAAMADLSA